MFDNIGIRLSQITLLVLLPRASSLKNFLSLLENVFRFNNKYFLEVSPPIWVPLKTWRIILNQNDPQLDHKGLYIRKWLILFPHWTFTNLTLTGGIFEERSMTAVISSGTNYTLSWSNKTITIDASLSAIFRREY